MLRKSMIHEVCAGLLEARLKEIRDEISSLRESLEQETKSSVGDKHETSRARLQQEEANVTLRLMETESMYTELMRIDPSNKPQRTGAGSLVKTDHGTFYLAVALGKIKVMGEDVFVISPRSPLGGAIAGAKEGDTVDFRQTYRIINIT